MRGVLLGLSAQLVAGLPATSQTRDETLPVLGLANITEIGVSDIKGRSLYGPALNVDVWLLKLLLTKMFISLFINY